MSMLAGTACPKPALLFCFKSSRGWPHMTSFPTRRSSDLGLRFHDRDEMANDRAVQTGNADMRDLPLRDWICQWIRSEEHTSELQSPCNLVCRLRLEKKTARRRPAETAHKAAE